MLGKKVHLEGGYFVYDVFVRCKEVKSMCEFESLKPVPGWNAIAAVTKCPGSPLYPVKKKN